MAIRTTCACDCGEPVTAGRNFVPGHDTKLRARLEKLEGGLLKWKDKWEPKEVCDDGVGRVRHGAGHLAD